MVAADCIESLFQLHITSQSASTYSNIVIFLLAFTFIPFSASTKLTCTQISVSASTTPAVRVRVTTLAPPLNDATEPATTDEVGLSEVRRLHTQAKGAPSAFAGNGAAEKVIVLPGFAPPSPAISETASAGTEVKAIPVRFILA
jgi:hypothetical protein